MVTTTHNNKVDDLKNNNFKHTLNIKEFSNVLLLKHFLVVYPFTAIKYSLFDNLSEIHKKNILKYAIGSFFKGSLNIKYNKNDACVLVFNIWSNGYHHFIMEVLPKILIYKDFFKDKTLLIPDNAPLFIQEALSICGAYNLSKISTHLFSKKLYVIENPNSGYYNPKHIELIRSALVPKNISNVEGTKIYVSRKSARSRRIINENELENLLLNYGFVIIEAENLTFQQQINLFAQAHYFIASHGAGLTNMVFMKTNSIIIELMPEFNSNDLYPINYCYARLADSLNFKYECIFCEREDDKTAFDTCNLTININELTKKLEQI